MGTKEVLLWTVDEYNSFEEIYSYAKAVIERGLLYG
jgi:hypothetical protein